MSKEKEMNFCVFGFGCGPVSVNVGRKTQELSLREFSDKSQDDKKKKLYQNNKLKI